ncbi:hypothetical protein [Streptomyces albogriseolus]|uniref:hypothetical protein n=1 Tax=Streptomyces albogriseolus TaxID=1887 RepID=UPI0034611B46
MRTTLSIAESIAKDVKRAGKRLATAQTELIEQLQKGYRLDTGMTDRLIREEAMVSLWTGVERALQIESEKTGDAEEAARTAIAKGRERALQIVLNGPVESTSLSRRAKGDIEVEAARVFYRDLQGYED